MITIISFEKKAFEEKSTTSHWINYLLILMTWDLTQVIGLLIIIILIDILVMIIMII